MRIYQRFLYVGLGGTGLQIGTQLEQRLRMELCGADGQALSSLPALGGAQLSPFELPPFIQFVYADFDDRERKAVEAASERLTRSAAARKTAEYLGNLTPHQNSYALVSESLRSNVYQVVRNWLPPKDNEPQVHPLSDGAGQYPTVGRAALFETIRAQGLSAVEGPLERALGRLAGAKGDLEGYLGRPPLAGCDVFVGFSVAGGTGAGIFYDFLRLISWKVGKTLGKEARQTHIYPLVLLPSAFDEGRGGGRAAQLNAGPALRELFDVIDRCNKGLTLPDAETAYPGKETERIGDRVEARTAFVFRRPEAISLSDLHRSIVAFVISLIGTEVQADHGPESGSFASWFVNRAGERQTDAPDGIGAHPASTALAAQLTIPLEEISEILAGRLVAQATRALCEPRQTENNRDEIQAFIAAMKLTPLQDRRFDDPLPTVPPDTKGAKEIFSVLTQRREAAIQYHKAFQRAVDQRVAHLAETFNYADGVRAAADKFDLFRVARIALGDQRLSDNRVNREGVQGFLRRRAEPLPAPDQGFTTAPPTPPQLRNKLGGGVKVKLLDQAPRNALAQQDVWYQWRAEAEWHTAWNKYAEYWRPKVESMRTTLNEIVEAFDTHATNEDANFRDSCHRLYDATRGVVYFLPEGGGNNDLNLFYEAAVLKKLRERLHLPEGDGAAEIVNAIMGKKWLDAYQATSQAPTKEALRYVLDQVEEQIYRILADEGEDDRPILPRLSSLLAAVASGRDATSEFPAGLLDRFRTSLGSLVPSGFEPEGSSRLGVQLFYPAAGPSGEIEDFLAHTVTIGERRPEFHQIADANFLGVVLTRVALPASEIAEYRDLMRIWADAVDTPRRGDYLPWRQRLGYDTRWIVLSGESRIEVLLRILNAMWDGSIEVTAGSQESPETVRIHQFDAPGAPPIELNMKAYGELSRWSNVLRAYERYAIGAEDTVSERCAQLMKRITPTGISEEPQPPSDLYKTFRELVPKQAAAAEAVHEKVADGAKPMALQAVEFWTQTVGAALEHEFEHGGGPRGRNHIELYDSFSKAG